MDSCEGRKSYDWNGIFNSEITKYKTTIIYIYHRYQILSPMGLSLPSVKHSRCYQPLKLLSSLPPLLLLLLLLLPHCLLLCVVHTDDVKEILGVCCGAEIDRGVLSHPLGLRLGGSLGLGGRWWRRVGGGEGGNQPGVGVGGEVER